MLQWLMLPNLMVATVRRVVGVACSCYVVAAVQSKFCCVERCVYLQKFVKAESVCKKTVAPYQNNQCGNASFYHHTLHGSEFSLQLCAL